MKDLGPRQQLVAAAGIAGSSFDPGGPVRAAGVRPGRRDRPSDTFRGWLQAITRNAIATHSGHQTGRARAEGGSEAWPWLQEVADPLAAGAEEETAEVNCLERRALEQVRGEFEERIWQAFC